MIVFDLECINGHVFEGWFDDRDDLSRQQEQGLLQCPVCDSFSVSPKLSAVAIRRSAAPVSGGSGQEMASQAQLDAMAEFAERMTQYVENNYENVGSSFAKEALEMHYGVKEFKQIRGTTTKEEEKTLEKEGVPVFKLPTFNTDNEDLN
ncbi:MAG TPA: DUF1178 family protein [Desulfobacter postgatei]|jgi:hypothetical protein|uniref:DUF1178 family protein n=1 Tax=Desulfobacter sp. UBA2225 TaxID=1961413 RepID=UPI002580BAE5|nr:DUF1178 family protein [Desulfobacter sp. UBA2225]MDQ1269067.1 hypothetical protein [Thermodesulfobacteriota bacterium]HRF89492.1 DUF1178 family protein [Desulfobacter postgatei]